MLRGGFYTKAQTVELTRAMAACALARAAKAVTEKLPGAGPISFSVSPQCPANMKCLCSFWYSGPFLMHNKVMICCCCTPILVPISSVPSQLAMLRQVKQEASLAACLAGVAVCTWGRARKRAKGEHVVCGRGYPLCAASFPSTATQLLCRHCHVPPWGL
jgi:hypothetical protein